MNFKPNGKKGYYTASLTVIVLISVIVIYTGLQSKLTDIGSNIGDAQSPIIGINNEVQFYQAYVQDAAKLAIEKAVDDVAVFPQLQGLSTPETIAAGYCTYLNTRERPQRLAYTVHFHEGIKAAFNQNMNIHLARYTDKTGLAIPLNNFEVTAFKGELIGVARKPTEIPIKDYAGRVLGTAGFRPSFKIKYNHKFEEYPQIFEVLANMARQCSYTPDPAECNAVKSVPNNWKVEVIGADTYQFKIPRGKKEACYVLTLPPKISQPTT